MSRLHQARKSSLKRSNTTSKRSKKSKSRLRKGAKHFTQEDISKSHPFNHKQEPIRADKDLKETTQLVDQYSKPPKERWVALFLFSALTLSQCCIWNTWGPIAGTAIIAFPTWHKYTVALLPSWGCITYMICCLPCCWLLHAKGLTVPLKLAAVVSILGTFLRCISSQEIIFTITAHMAAILNGLAGVIIGPATALVSAVWFPRGERTTATGISSASNQLGLAVSYLIGPAVVHATNTGHNVSRLIIEENARTFIRKKHSLHMIKQIQLAPDLSMFKNSALNPAASRGQIMSLMRIEFVAHFLLVLAVLRYLPKQRPTLKDDEGNMCRISMIDSVLYLIKNKCMWQLCSAAALSQGVTGPWLAMLTITFSNTITQEQADRLAFWTIVCSSVLSLIVSRVTDIFEGHLKITLFIFLAVSSVMFLWVLLLMSSAPIFHLHELYAAIILGISASWATPALFLELAAEIADPVSEAVVGGYMIFLANLIGSLIYFSYFIPGIEYWLTYCVLGCLVIAAALVGSLKEEYNRMKRQCSGVD